jgi:hypothetical protein
MGNYKEDNMLEKHYTTKELYNNMFDVLKEFYDGEITEFLENSAGDGRMIDFLKEKTGLPVIAYDIKNETERKDIIELDYLKHKIEYKKGRVGFINPPFNKAIKFIYKTLEECDYCVAITGSNTFLNLDYDKYEVDTIDVYRQYNFGSCKVNITIIAIRKK